MSLILYYHPLSSFCWKALIALYENQAMFEPRSVDLGDEKSRAAFLKVAPMGQFPVIEDRGQIVPQSSFVVEYVDTHYPGTAKLIPADAERSREARRWNEFFDTYIHVHMQKIVGDCLRTEGRKDPTGVADARRVIRTAYDVLEKRMQDRAWCMGEDYTIADCSASPALFYGNVVEPFIETHPNLARYFARLKARPAFARVLKEAEPYFPMFPYKKIAL